MPYPYQDDEWYNAFGWYGCFRGKGMTQCVSPPVVPRPSPEDFTGEYADTPADYAPDLRRQTNINVPGRDFTRRRKRHKHE